MPTFHHPRRVIVDEGGESQAAKALVPLAALIIGAGIIAAIETVLVWIEAAVGVLGFVPVPLALLLPGALAFTAVGFIVGRRAILTIHPAPRPRQTITARVVGVGPARRAVTVPGRGAAITSGNTPRLSQDTGTADSPARRTRGAA